MTTRAAQKDLPKHEPTNSIVLNAIEALLLLAIGLKLQNTGINSAARIKQYQVYGISNPLHAGETSGPQDHIKTDPETEANTAR